jgi:hypothetical protein
MNANNNKESDHPIVDETWNHSINANSDASALHNLSLHPQHHSASATFDFNQQSQQRAPPHLPMQLPSMGHPQQQQQQQPQHPQQQQQQHVHGVPHSLMAMTNPLSHPNLLYNQSSQATTAVSSPHGTTDNSQQQQQFHPSLFQYNQQYGKQSHDPRQLSSPGTPTHPMYLTQNMNYLPMQMPIQQQHAQQFSSPQHQQPQQPSTPTSATTPGSSGTGSGQKRKINKLACEYCSKLHKKCDGDHPNPCSRCKQKGTPCVYVQRRKRGPKTKRVKTSHNSYEDELNTPTSASSQQSGTLSPYGSQDVSQVDLHGRGPMVDDTKLGIPQVGAPYNPQLAMMFGGFQQFQQQQMQFPVQQHRPAQNMLSQMSTDPSHYQNVAYPPNSNPIRPLHTVHQHTHLQQATPVMQQQQPLLQQQQHVVQQQIPQQLQQHQQPKEDIPDLAAEAPIGNNTDHYAAAHAALVEEDQLDSIHQQQQQGIQQQHSAEIKAESQSNSIVNKQQVPQQDIVEVKSEHQQQDQQQQEIKSASNPPPYFSGATQNFEESKEQQAQSVNKTNEESTTNNSTYEDNNNYY